MDNRLTNTYHIFDKSKLIAEYTRYIFNYGNNKIGYSIKNYHNIFYKIVVFIVFLFLILTLLCAYNINYFIQILSLCSENTVNSIILIIKLLITASIFFLVTRLLENLLINEIEISNYGITLHNSFFTTNTISFDNLKRVSFKSTKLSKNKSRDYAIFEFEENYFDSKNSGIFLLNSFFKSFDRNNIYIDLNKFDSSEDESKFYNSIFKFIPAYQIDTSILNKGNFLKQSKSYTEIWLDSLEYISTDNLTINDKSDIIKTLKDNLYTVEELIAIGGQSKIYSGFNINNQKVIIKEFILPFDIETSEIKRIIKNIVLEASVLNKIQHNNIVEFEELFIENHCCYLITKYVSGISLNKFDTSKLTLNEILFIAKQMLTILDYIHNQDPPIIHRDFSLDNLILDENLKLTLIDFNIAMTNEFKYSKIVPGKISYMSPEQFTGIISIQNDLYSFGVCLYKLLTNLEHEPLSQINFNHTNKDINKILLKTTTQDNKLRYSSAKQILSEKIFNVI